MNVISVYYYYGVLFVCHIVRLAPVVSPGLLKLTSGDEWSLVAVYQTGIYLAV